MNGHIGDVIGTAACHPRVQIVVSELAEPVRPPTPLSLESTLSVVQLDVALAQGWVADHERTDPTLDV